MSGPCQFTGMERDTGAMGNRRTDPPGTTPWDRWNGARVGGLVGGILGIVMSATFDDLSFGYVLIAAAIGAVAGYWSQRSRSRR